MGGCYATSLGATLHEMGHVFDLVHSDRGIMARGFEDIDLFFTLENPQRNIIQKGLHTCRSLQINFTSLTSLTFS